MEQTKIETRRSIGVDGLWRLGLETIRELETEQGILASGREEIYGCVFGRDSLISALKLLRTYRKTGDLYFIHLSKKIILGLADLQGQVKNVESGEEPGKIIHEFREKDHEHLTARTEKPWFLYPDGKMRNYDSVDSTPLFLLAASRHFELSGDLEFFKSIEPAAKRALCWLLSNIDIHKEGFVSYEFPKERIHGGLATQSWMDSETSIFDENGEKIFYPIAPVEVQGYAHIALRRWSRHLSHSWPSESLELELRAKKLKENFNKRFIANEPDFKIAFALEGQGRPLYSRRSNPGHLLWNAWNFRDGSSDSILESIFIPKLVASLFDKDIFEPEAGIRTLGKSSKNFDPMSYHNGSIWPHDNAIIKEGLEDFGFGREAHLLRQTLVNSWNHFYSPIELFTYDHGFKEYLSPEGQKACLSQAWSAASILSEL